MLYIFWFLHQTTTLLHRANHWFCCISFDSYIKPQPDLRGRRGLMVVYLLIPTSNHNSSGSGSSAGTLYIFWFLHQTTTGAWLLSSSICCISFDSYIKPQPFPLRRFSSLRCISFDSYIKPQPFAYDKMLRLSCISFDSYIKPQLWAFLLCSVMVVYLLIPTSNHNGCQLAHVNEYVVYLLIPTSNHNIK